MVVYLSNICKRNNDFYSASYYLNTVNKFRLSPGINNQKYYQRKLYMVDWKQVCF